MARQSMREDAQRVRGFLERDNLEISVKLLDTHVPQLCERFPAALLAAFRRGTVAEASQGVLSTHALHMDQLELMDEAQVQERVEMARVLQHVMLKVEASLTELNTYVCALMGLDHVSPSRNPLRPDVYVETLQQLMTDIAVPATVRTAWFGHLSEGFGGALNAAYQEWSALLRGQGVRPVGFSVVRTPDLIPAPLKEPESEGETEVRKDRPVWSPQYRQTVLTLDRLRRLMVGDLEPPPSNPKEAFARQFAREFETDTAQTGRVSTRAPDTGFETTVPAAFEALQEMQQVEKVVQRLEQRPVLQLVRPEAQTPPRSVREELVFQARGLNQLLSLEVVSLMVDNLVDDTRLLAPIRKIIRGLDPALLRLVLIDPRFFIDRQHPARRLLQEISGRGLAFGAETDSGFNAFLLSLQRYVSPLATLHFDSAKPFELALDALLSLWDSEQDQQAISNQIDSAVLALGNAEERNLLAQEVAGKLRAMHGMNRVPTAVVDFLCGPWSQVLASAKLGNVGKPDAAKRYRELANALLWSAQPELTRKEVGKLTKLVPKLLSNLREGLQLIDYPSVKTSAFFDVLMKLHQQAFRPAPATQLPKELVALEESLLGDQDHWVAPAEAKASGFMAFPEDLPAKASAPVSVSVADTASQVPVSLPVQVAQTEIELDAVSEAASLSVGAWIELQIKGVWQRTQLSWISPHSTMYLFTTVQGKTQSMTQRMLVRMLAQGTLRVVSAQQNMVDGALDTVVHTAMLNSLDIKL